MNKRYVPVVGLTVVLAVLALVGYLRPAAKAAVPVRILLQNPGGAVVFDHLGHERADMKCVQCHHASKVSTTEVPCSVCHPGEFDETFKREHMHWFEGRAACATCHHLEWDRPVYSHEIHIDLTGGDCSVCHHDPAVGGAPQACRNCHDETPEAGMPILKEAAHTRCRSCHEEDYDQELAGCQRCHSRRSQERLNLADPIPCEHCHDKPNASLVPARKDAMHKQCMGCHKRLNKGPFRDEKDVKDCGRCHLPPQVK